MERTSIDDLKDTSSDTECLLQDGHPQEARSQRVSIKGLYIFSIINSSFLTLHATMLFMIPLWRTQRGNLPTETVTLTTHGSFERRSLVV